jgi:NAD(P)-dependent dehydrogenase (short-subunit alcohol dehydrogenase family)
MTQIAQVKTVVVTGGSRGIGAHVARTLAATGHRVIAVGRDEPRLARLLIELEQLSPNAHETLAFDVRNEGAWQRLAHRVERVDGLVTAAGIYGPIGRLDSVELTAVRETLDVNVMGTVTPVRELLPRLRESHGAIVFFAGGGSKALPGYDAYRMSKAAVVLLAENLATGLAADGIRVNSVAPGFVATDIHAATLAAGPEQAGADFYQQTVQTLAEGGASIEEAAQLVAFLLSAGAAGLTGRFFSARWDDWRSIDWLAAASESADSLTMRRIDDCLFRASSPC